MSLSKAEKKRLQAMNRERIKIGKAPIVRSQPKAKGSPIVGIAAVTETPQRRREPEQHPLDKIRAKMIGQGGQSAWNAGNTVRVMFEKLERSGMDSISALTAIRGGGSGQDWTVEQVQCQKALDDIRDRLPTWEWGILEKVCGAAWPINLAIHAHAICHEDGTLMMFWNTLDHLAAAITRAPIPYSVHRDAMERRRMAG